MRFRAVLVVVGALLVFLGVSVLGSRSAHADTARAPRTADAPLCDERAASAYADDPAPQPVDAGDIDRAPDSGCKALVASGAPVPSKDDLSRTPEVPHDTNTLVPAAAMVVPAMISSDAERTIAIDRPSDEHRLNDNPPPRPIPWRG